MSGQVGSNRKLTNSVPLDVVVNDASGDPITSFGGSGGASHADDAAFTIGSASSTTPAGFLADETAPDSVDEGDVGVARMTTNRLQLMVISDAASEKRAGVVDLATRDALAVAIVDSSGDQITSFGGGTQYTEDAVAAANPVGTALILVREDARAGSLVTTDGDNVAARGNNKGELYVKHTDAVVLPVQIRNVAYGAYTAITVTNLQSLASSATAGWQSGRLDNQTSVKALDYEIFVKLTTANTAPANDKAAYIYISDAITTDGGTTWLQADQGTATLPTGTEGTTTIASPNNLKLLGILSYTTQQMVMQKSLFLSNAIGRHMPDGFSIIIVNFTGAALSTSCVVAYRAITATNT